MKEIFYIIVHHSVVKNNLSTLGKDVGKLVLYKNVNATIYDVFGMAVPCVTTWENIVEPDVQWHAGKSNDTEVAEVKKVVRKAYDELFKGFGSKYKTMIAGIIEAAKPPHEVSQNLIDITDDDEILIPDQPVGNTDEIPTSAPLKTDAPDYMNTDGDIGDITGIPKMNYLDTDIPHNPHYPSEKPLQPVKLELPQRTN